jgi:hypothetical protein
MTVLFREHGSHWNHTSTTTLSRSYNNFDLGVYQINIKLLMQTDGILKWFQV